MLVEGRNFLEQLGYSKVPFVIYAEQRPGLPGEFDFPNGLKALRTGPVVGGTFRPPTEDWISGAPKGPDRTVQLASIFVYDPKAGEILDVREKDVLIYFRKREEYRRSG